MRTLRNHRIRPLQTMISCLSLDFWMSVALIESGSTNYVSVGVIYTQQPTLLATWFLTTTGWTVNDDGLQLCSDGSGVTAVLSVRSFCAWAQVLMDHTAVDEVLIFFRPKLKRTDLSNLSPVLSSWDWQQHPSNHCHILITEAQTSTTNKTTKAQMRAVCAPDIAEPSIRLTTQTFCQHDYKILEIPFQPIQISSIL